jgi:hypothetical protein
VPSPSTHGSGAWVLASCLRAARCLPAARYACDCMVLPAAAWSCFLLLAAGLLTAYLLHACDFSWRVWLLALWQALLEPLPALCIFSAACGRLLLACFLLAQAFCRLHAAFRLLPSLWAV